MSWFYCHCRSPPSGVYHFTTPAFFCSLFFCLLLQGSVDEFHTWDSAPVKCPGFHFHSSPDYSATFSSTYTSLQDLLVSNLSLLQESFFCFSHLSYIVPELFSSPCWRVWFCLDFVFPLNKPEFSSYVWRMSKFFDFIKDFFLLFSKT